MKIYTKTGDSGETSLFDGARVPKCDARVEAYGTVDELNAAVGQAISLLPAQDEPTRELLTAIQRRLFNIGAILADPARKSPKKDKESVGDADIAPLEKAIDAWEAELPPLRAFILPGGSPAGAALHLARTVCRRAERLVTQLHRTDGIPPVVIQYLNRLSDFLFVAARFVNMKQGLSEETW